MGVARVPALCTVQLKAKLDVVADTVVTSLLGNTVN